MVASSKVFVQHYSWRSCSELLHPHSCQHWALQNLWRFARSNTKYYLPVVMLHLIKRSLRGCDIPLFRDALQYYVELVFGGVLVGSTISASICALRHLLGEFKPATLLFVPSLLGGAWVCLMSLRVKHLHHTAIFQALIETFLLQRDNYLTKSLASSLLLQTLLFMSCSSIILLGKKLRWHNGFWFLAPENTPPNTAENSNSIQYVLKGMRKYMLIGLALDVFKGLVSCMNSGKWIWKQFSLETMTWLGCYMGIYRATLCYLRRQQNVSKTLEQLLPSFLGGLSYVCYPKRTILSYALLEAGRTLWGSCNKHTKRRFGYTDMVYPFALAYLIHTYVLQPKRVSALTGIIIDSTTASYAKNISKRLKHLQPALRMA